MIPIVILVMMKAIYTFNSFDLNINFFKSDTIQYNLGYGYGDQDGRGGGGGGGWEDDDQMQGHGGGRDDFEVRTLRMYVTYVHTCNNNIPKLE